MRIAVCSPVYGDTVKAPFAYCLGRMMHFAGRAKLPGAEKQEIELFQVPALLPVSRNRLVRKALEWSADWTLWLDSDQTFPPQTLHQLLSHGLPLVGCNIVHRHAPTPMAWAHGSNGKPQPVFTTKAKVEAREVEPVEQLGLGVCLISVQVFRALPADPFWFEQTTNGDWVGEDTGFFRAAKKVGFQPHVDHALSWHIGHLDQTIRTHKDIASKEIGHIAETELRF